MPSEVADIKQFLEIARRKDASSARIKKSPKKKTPGAGASVGTSAKASTHHGGGKEHQQFKFKIRCHRFLYTLVLKDEDKADKLKQSLPPNMNVTEITKKTAKKNAKKS